MGSVKDLEVTRHAREDKEGGGDFVFSERYSVFDWGEMPDSIINKGRALATMAAFNFEGLEKRGIRTHYRSLVDGLGRPLGFDDLPEFGNGSDRMRVSLAMVYHPIARPVGEGVVEYDYSFYEANRGGIGNFLVPLEVIFRNGLPLGSSVFGKIDRAKAIADSTERDAVLQRIYRELGVTEEPKPGDVLPRPVVSYTTKLEAGDRVLTADEAYRISGLTEEQFARVGPLALEINDFVTGQVEREGLGPHWDGKVEMRYRSGGLEVVDVVGTPDENRFGSLVSKELLRQLYIRDQPEFVAACEEWKSTGKGWQERCPVKPVRLSQNSRTLASQMYMAACNAYVGKRIFGTKGISEVRAEIAELGI